MEPSCEETDVRRSLAAVALSSLLLSGCEIFLVGAAVVMTTMVFRGGEGRKLYNHPYGQVVPVVEDAARQMGLYGMEIDADKDETVITGKDVDGESVKIWVEAKDSGRQAEVRVRVGLGGDLVGTTLIFDAVNEGLGLPPEPSKAPPTAPY